VPDDAVLYCGVGDPETVGTIAGEARTAGIDRSPRRCSSGVGARDLASSSDGATDVRRGAGLSIRHAGVGAIRFAASPGLSKGVGDSRAEMGRCGWRGRRLSGCPRRQRLCPPMNDPQGKPTPNAMWARRRSTCASRVPTPSGPTWSQVEASRPTRSKRGDASKHRDTMEYDAGAAPALNALPDFQNSRGAPARRSPAL